MYDEIDYINKDIMQEFINSKNSLRQGNGSIYENDIDIIPKEKLNTLQLCQTVVFILDARIVRALRCVCHIVLQTAGSGVDI